MLNKKKMIIYNLTNYRSYRSLVYGYIIYGYKQDPLFLKYHVIETQTLDLKQI